MSEGWKETTIGQCLDASFSGEWGVEPKPANALVFRATDIDDEGRIVGNGAERRLPIGKLTAKRLQEGDILLEGSGGGPGKPVGRVAYFEGATCKGSAVCSNFFKTLRPNRSEVDPRFLLRKLAWFYKQPTLLMLQQQTTGIINLKFEEYLSALIEIPKSIYEQQKLAQVLDTLDTAIHETEAIIAKLKAVKQGLLHDLLTRGIDANGELRPPQVEAPHLYKESPLGWIPKEWDTQVFGDTIEHVIDFRGRTPKKLGMDWGGGDILALSANNVQPGGIDISREAYFGGERLYRKWMTSGDVRKGDVLLTMEAPLGNVAQIPDDARYILSQRVIALRFRPDKILNDFAFWQMQSTEFQRAMVKRSTGSTATGIQRAELVKLHLKAPPVDEQSLIAQRLFTVEHKLASELAALNKQKQEKSGLMDDLLTGRVRVTPLLAAAAQQPGIA